MVMGVPGGSAFAAGSLGRLVGAVVASARLLVEQPEGLWSFAFGTCETHVADVARAVGGQTAPALSAAAFAAGFESDLAGPD